MANLLNTEGPVQDTELTQVTLEEWKENRDSLSGQNLELTLESSETADLIGDDSASFQRISINFPKFADGRGYSAARLLRERFAYKGELRATGDVLIDQLYFMKRCGFDTFALRDDQIIEDAIAAFSTFTVNYQNDANDQQPLFRRRLS
ncbi:MAG: DUF934 domain-containing protein [Alcanivorax sp.]|jgi:uncharacterized protein (DUF934 family)|nr:MAG: oxidoreductase [Oceanobacter sp.]|tara:strand:+ start:489 stop:935 length:447 start_codon:yes stop_codon:yes gene_type:complete